MLPKQVPSRERDDLILLREPGRERALPRTRLSCKPQPKRSTIAEQPARWHAYGSGRTDLTRTNAQTTSYEQQPNVTDPLPNAAMHAGKRTQRRRTEHDHPQEPALAMSSRRRDGLRARRAEREREGLLGRGALADGPATGEARARDDLGGRAEDAEGEERARGGHRHRALGECSADVGWAWGSSRFPSSDCAPADCSSRTRNGVLTVSVGEKAQESTEQTWVHRKQTARAEDRGGRGGERRQPALLSPKLW